jgi:hypothetical protein
MHSNGEILHCQPISNNFVPFSIKPDSKSYDDITKTYHFVNREYDSFSGRWLTPDPSGFADGQTSTPTFTITP